VSGAFDSVDQALAAARAAGLDRLDAQLLLARELGRTRAWLIAHGDAPLAPDAATRFAAALQRRAAGEPLAYLLGEKEFHGLRLAVDARVLVPRPDTELLVDWALEILRGRGPGPATVVDLGTGSGAIGLAVKQRHPDAVVTATDRSEDALAVARANAAALGLDVEFVAGSWWEPLGTRRFDLVLANPPYIAAADPHLRALQYEPQEALTSGEAGLDALRAIVATAPQRLAAGGWLLLEHGWDQAEAVAALLAAQELQAIETRRDLGGQPRCTGGRRL